MLSEYLGVWDTCCAFFPVSWDHWRIVCASSVLGEDKPVPSVIGGLLQFFLLSIETWTTPFTNIGEILSKKASTPICGPVPVKENRYVIFLALEYLYLIHFRRQTIYKRTISVPPFSAGVVVS